MYILHFSSATRLFRHRQAQTGGGGVSQVNPMPRCSRIEIDVDYTRNDVKTDVFDMYKLDVEIICVFT
jgi:hypothetical protein